MDNLLVMAGAETTMVTSESLTSLLDLIKVGVSGVMDIANSGFDFIMGNALLAFVVCSGFAFTAFGLFRSAIKTAHRT